MISKLILTWLYAFMILIDNHSQVWCPLGPSHQHHPTKRRALSVWGGRWGLLWWPMANYGWWRIIGGFLDICILDMWRWAQRRQNSKQLPKILWWQWYIPQPQVPPSPYHICWPKFLHLITLTVSKYVRSKILNFRTCAQSSWPKSE